MRQFVAIGLLALLIGCSSAVKTPIANEPTPAPTAPTLHGTWATTSPVWRDDEVIGMATEVLTFTKSRYIQYTLEEEFDGTFINDGAQSGTWSAGDTMATRTWVGWDDENNTWQTQTTSVVKDYVWTEDGSALFMEPWGYEQESDEFARYTKVDIPEPYPFAGSWMRVRSSQTSSRVLTQTFVFNDDMFTFIEHDTNGDDQATTIGTLTGTWRIEHDEKFILVSVESASGGNDAFGAQTFKSGQTLRIGYAPTNDVEKIQFSPYWREQRYDSQQNAWVDNERLERMYGSYTYQFARETVDAAAN